MLDKKGSNNSKNVLDNVVIVR